MLATNRVFLLILLITGTTVHAQGWRGIVPLHSTRQEVEKVIGAPIQPGGMTYALEDERVNMVYSNGKCADGKVEWNVPPETVIGITIYPKTRRTIHEVRKDLQSFVKVVDPHDPDSAHYNNDVEGVSYGTTRDVIETIYYFPAAKDSYLRCANFSRNRVTVDELDYFRFDEFFALSRSDERARLDNFAARLRDRQTSKGYIIVYPGKRENATAAKAKANRMRSYLTKAGRINAARVNTIIVAGKEKGKTGLFVVPSSMSVVGNQHE